MSYPGYDPVRFQAYESLWNEWKSLEYQLRGLSGIVQNPCPSTPEDLVSFFEGVTSFNTRFGNLVEDTRLAVVDANPELVAP